MESLKEKLFQKCLKAKY